jgi:hypothetical protein
MYVYMGWAKSHPALALLLHLSRSLSIVSPEDGNRHSIRTDGLLDFGHGQEFQIDRLCGLVVRVPGYRSRGPFTEKQWVWNGLHSAS